MVLFIYVVHGNQENCVDFIVLILAYTVSLFKNGDLRMCATLIAIVM